MNDKASLTADLKIILVAATLLLTGCDQPNRSQRPLTDKEGAAIMVMCSDMGLESMFSAESYNGIRQVDFVGCHAPRIVEPRK